MKRALYTSMGVAATALLAGTSLAQDPPQAAALQGSGSDSGNELQDIVVTATRRGENLQKVPIAVSAFSAEQLGASGVEGYKDLDLTTPGLSITSNGQGQTVYLRGVGSSDTSPGQEAPVALYVDGVYQPSAFGNAIPFNNVERVEVLKGPQGTLFGRNATGGLIHVITRDPSSDPGAEASLSYGNYQAIEAKAYVTGPVADGISADLAGYYYYQGDGWGKNLFNGRDIFRSKSGALRSKWVLQPSSSTKITLMGDYRKEESSNSFNFRIIPGSLTDYGATPTSRFHDLNVNLDPFAATRAWSTSAKIEQDIGTLTLQSVTSYQNIRFNIRWDNDAGAANIVAVDTPKAITNTFTQELIISSSPTANPHWIAGLYYLNMEAGWDGPQGITLYGDGVIPGGLGLDIISVVKSHSYSAFAEMTYDIADSTHLTLGFRYTVDKRRLNATTLLDAQPPQFSPIANLGENSDKATFKEPTYRAILSQDIGADAMIYGSYSHGFKSGNYNTTNPANPSFDPEFLDAYEIGFKSRILENRFQINGAAFYYDYSNLQVLASFGNTNIVQNAASATVKGFEIDSTLSVTDKLRIRGGYTFLDGTYKDFKQAACFFPAIGGGNLPIPCDVSGNRIVRTPRSTVNAGLDYTLPTEIGDFVGNISYYHNAGFNFTPDARLREKAYDILNMNLTWSRENSPLRVSLWAKNVLNERYASYQVAQNLGDQQVAAAPRTYGIELGFKF